MYGAVWKSYLVLYRDEMENIYPASRGYIFVV